MRYKLSLLSLVLLTCSACVVPPPHARYQREAPQPCKPHVSPISYQTMVTSISVNYTYTPKDQSAARPWHQGDVLDYLNGLGKPNGNSFVAQNGQPVNFYFTYSINNDGQDHFTGSLQFSGWGWGYINTFNTQYAYSDTQQMTRDLTNQAYAFISGGWHDTRTTCPQY
jgi:hypothetical protein